MDVIPPQYLELDINVWYVQTMTYVKNVKLQILINTAWCNAKKESITTKWIKFKECSYQKSKEVKIHSLISSPNSSKDCQRMLKLRNVGLRKVKNLLRRIRMFLKVIEKPKQWSKNWLRNKSRKRKLIKKPKRRWLRFRWKRKKS